MNNRPAKPKKLPPPPPNSKCYIIKDCEIMKKQSSEIREKRKRLEDALEKAKSDLLAFQKKCPHRNSVYENFGKSNGYDSSEDLYWRHWQCYDCGKRWQTDQKDTPSLTAIKANYKTKEEIRLLLELRGVFNEI